MQLNKKSFQFISIRKSKSAEKEFFLLGEVSTDYDIAREHLKATHEKTPLWDKANPVQRTIVCEIMIKEREL